MNTNDIQPDEARQGDLDDRPGTTYALDDGRPGSGNHEAVVRVQSDATVHVACSCGDWERVGEALFGREGDTAVLAAWEEHVYQATGRESMAPDKGFCESPVGVTMAVVSGRDIVFLWSCLQHADEWATTLESEFGMMPERAARPTPSAKCGHQGSQSMLSVAIDAAEYAVEVDMGAVYSANGGFR